jgi:hypothetical protein
MINDTPLANDVLSGRGRRILNHPGNQRYQSIIKSLKPLFDAAPANSLRRVLFGNQIVNLIHNLSPPGRFLKKDKVSESWIEVDKETAVKRVSDRLSADKVRVIPLSVSGAFHSPLMESAASKFAAELENVKFEELKVPLITNVSGEEVESKKIVKELLVKQLKESVQWEKSITTMIDKGVDTFIEIGPGKTLAGLIKKINRRVKVLNVNTFDSIEIVSAQLKGE